MPTFIALVYDQFLSIIRLHEIRIQQQKKRDDFLNLFGTSFQLYLNYPLA